MKLPKIKLIIFLVNFIDPEFLVFMEEHLVVDIQKRDNLRKSKHEDYQMTLKEIELLKFFVFKSFLLCWWATSNLRFFFWLVWSLDSTCVFFLPLVLDLYVSEHSWIRFVTLATGANISPLYHALYHGVC